MTVIYGLLVGAHFRPPAKAVLAALPAETPLALRAEPDNPYDPDAMAVWLNLHDLEVAVGLGTKARLELEDALPGAGWTWEALIASGDEVQLGYLARAGNRELAKLAYLAPAGAFAEGHAVLQWGPNGEAIIQGDSK